MNLGDRWPDLAVVILYLAGMTAIGIWFSRGQKTAENFFVAKRSVPPWAMGMSMLATLISSVTFVAYPGSSYAGNWSLLVPGFFVIAVLPLVRSVIIPFYRDEVRMSAYEYFENRFGRFARLYGSFAFSLAHFSKMGFVLYLMALTLSSMTGWNVEVVIVSAAAAMVVYTVLGGIEAVIWTDVVQGFVMWAGIAVALGYLLFLPADGPVNILQVAANQGKFQMGELAWNWRKPTIPVLVCYGFFWYLQRYVADQTMVQRYLLAKSDDGARKGVTLGALLTLPVWALFMLIGTATWAYFQSTGEALPAAISKADQVFPYFLSTHLPAGVLGLLLASLTGAAMTMLASDLNSLASVLVEDFYRRWRPESSGQNRLRAGRIVIVVAGLLNVLTALALVKTKGSVLSLWFAVSAIASGGLLGLFFLAFLVRRATPACAYVGIACNFTFTFWAVLTKGAKPVIDLGGLNYPFDELTIGALGNVLLFSVGALMGQLVPANAGSPSQATLWHWLERKRQAARAPSAAS